MGISNWDVHEDTSVPHWTTWFGPWSWILTEALCKCRSDPKMQSCCLEHWCSCHSRARLDWWPAFWLLALALGHLQSSWTFKDRTSNLTFCVYFCLSKTKLRTCFHDSVLSKGFSFQQQSESSLYSISDILVKFSISWDINTLFRARIIATCLFHGKRSFYNCNINKTKPSA